MIQFTKDHAAWRMQGGDSQEQAVSLPPGLTLELCEELLDSTVSWTVPYKQFLIDQQRAAWFVDGSPKVNRQRSV